MAAGSVVITEKKHPSVQLITFAWTSDASGNVTSPGNTIGRYTGQILQFGTVPGASVTTYTITLLDSNGFDLLGGKATSRSTTLPELLILPLMANNFGLFGAVSDDVLTIGVTGAGNAKTGTAYLWIR